MPTADERLGYLEAKVEAQGERLAEISQQVRHLDQKVDLFRLELSARIDTLDRKVDNRFSALDQEIDRFRGELSARISVIDQKLNSQFKWLMGGMATILVATVGAMAAMTASITGAMAAMTASITGAMAAIATH